MDFLNLPGINRRTRTFSTRVQEGDVVVKPASNLIQLHESAFDNVDLKQTFAVTVLPAGLTVVDGNGEEVVLEQNTPILINDSNLPGSFRAGKVASGRSYRFGFNTGMAEAFAEAFGADTFERPVYLTKQVEENGREGYVVVFDDKDEAIIDGYETTYNDIYFDLGEVISFSTTIDGKELEVSVHTLENARQQTGSMPRKNKSIFGPKGTEDDDEDGEDQN